MPNIVYLLLLAFLASNIRTLARQKGVSPIVWIVLMLIAWLVAGSIGCAYAMNYLGVDITAIKQVKDVMSLPERDQTVIALLTLFFAFGGYLLIRFILEKKEDIPVKKDTNAIGSDDLQPPSGR